MFEIKHKLEKDRHFTVNFKCYILELYLDKLNDLLSDGSKKHNDKLKIRENAENGMIFV